MAVLSKDSTDGIQEIYLHTEHTIGRSPTCTLTLRHRSVSGFHACVSWHGDRWVIRDLGSRNGTYVNEQRVRGRPQVIRAGDCIVFGDQEESWTLVDDSRPQALLIPMGADGAAGGAKDRARRQVLSDLQGFPSDEEPHTTIFQNADGRFFLESVDGEACEIVTGQEVSIGDAIYRVHLPGGAGAVPTTRTSSTGVVESSVGTMRLTLRAAPDEETAAAVIDAGAIQATLPPRVHLYLLLHLARVRGEESRHSDGGGQEVGADDAGSAGWVAVETVCDELRITREQLGLQVFRCRDDMKKLGLSDAGQIIDRQRRGWIRIGVPAERLTLGRL